MGIKIVKLFSGALYNKWQCKKCAVPWKLELLLISNLIYFHLFDKEMGVGFKLVTTAKAKILSLQVSRAKSCITFYRHNLLVLLISYSVCPWQAFTVSKARAYPSEASFTTIIAHKHLTRLKRYARYKHSSLSRSFGRKTFYDIGPRIFFVQLN